MGDAVKNPKEMSLAELAEALTAKLSALTAELRHLEARGLPTWEVRLDIRHATIAIELLEKQIVSA